MIFRKEAATLLCFLFFLSPSCQKTGPSSLEVWRLVDRLTREHIEEFPFSDSSLQSLEESVFPSFSFPLQDEGIGENPYHLKRKLRLGGRYVNVTLAPPPSRYRFDLDYPEGTLLEFGTGIVREKSSEENPSSSPEKKEEGVLFLITMEMKGRKEIVYQKYMKLDSSKKHVLSTHKLPLPHISQKIRLTFTTRGSQKAMGFWFNPVLYSSEKKGSPVILISLDTLRADHLGCYGYHRNTTPHTDSLSSQSALFSNVYATSPWTLPSHVSLLTSLFGVHHQVYKEDEKMDPSLITLADVLRQNSYFCSAFTGGGFVSALYGFSKGFDSYNQTTGGIWREDSAGSLGERVCRWLERNKEKKFFLFLHTYQPHNPYSSPTPYRNMFLQEDAPWKSIDLLHYIGGKKGVFQPLSPEKRQNVIDLYDGEIRYTDEKLVHPVMEKLKELGLYEQSLIVLTSDHGEEFYDHQGWEHGHTLYDELLKIPLIIKFPEGRFAGRKVDSIVRLVDIMPTVLDELGLDFPDYEMDGRSLIPFLEGTESGDRVFLADKAGNIVKSHIPQKISMNRGSKKLILNKKFKPQDKSFFVPPPPSIDPVEIFDIERDPQERRNAADRNAALANQIIEAINSLYQKAKKRKKFKAQIDKETRERLKALGYIR